jgi:hypothetical protein
VVTGRIVGLSRGVVPQVLVQRPDGSTLAVAPHLVSRVELEAFARRVRFPAPPGLGSLGDLGDDFAELIGDIQTKGRNWFFSRIRELTGLGVGYQTLAATTDSLGRPDWSADLRERAETVRHVLDALYWIVDTYLGGVDALPNVMHFVPSPEERNAPKAGWVPPVPLGVAPAILAAALKGLGIVSAAALLAYIASTASDYSVRAAQVAAAKENNNPDLLPEPEKGVVETVRDAVGTIVLVALLGLLWVNRDRIVGAARTVGQRREA